MGYLEHFVHLFNPHHFYEHLSPRKMNSGFKKDTSLNNKHVILLPMKIGTNSYLFVINIQSKKIFELSKANKEQNKQVQNFVLFLVELIDLHHKTFIKEDALGKYLKSTTTPQSESTDHSDME